MDDDDSPVNDEQKAAAMLKNSNQATLSGKRIHTIKAQAEICLQLRDSTYHCVSAQLQNLFQHFDLAKLTHGEILFLLVFLVGIESGLGECGSYERCAQSLRRHKFNIPAYFDAYNVDCLSREQPKYSSEARNTILSMHLCSTLIDEADFEKEQLLNFKLTGIVTGDAIIITITPLQADTGRPFKGHHPTQSIYLSILRYIIGVPQQRKEPLQQHLNKMHELSHLLRQQIFLPVQQYYLASIGVERFPALTALPSEVYDAIFHCLSNNQLCILANVNKRLNNLVKNSKHFTRAGAGAGVGRAGGTPTAPRKRFR